MKRTCNMLLRLYPEEKERLTQKARKANMSRESYCRAVLNGSEVREGPNADVAQLINQVRRVGYNIDQILKIANGQGLVDVPQLRKALEETHQVAQQIIKAYARTGS